MPERTEFIGYRSWNRIRNNGDAITPHIIQHIAGIPPRLVGPDVPHILGVGSILFFANENSHVWGSGVLNPDMPLPHIHKSSFHAVRGKKTLGFLRGIGVPLPDLPLGDPGIFVGDLVEALPTKDCANRYRAAFVPHHASVHHPLYGSISKSCEFVCVNILDDSLLPIQQLLQSEIVVSQSLHGLIYAESLGKPTIWISEREDEIWKFKFDDWYSTTDNPPRGPEPLTADVDYLLSRAEKRNSAICRGDLIQALPAKTLASQSAHFMDFRWCRAHNPPLLFIDKLFDAQGDYPRIEEGLLTRAAEKIFPLVYNMFSSWAERSYCLVLSASQPMSLHPQALSEMVAYLDQNANVDFAFVHPRSTITSQVQKIIEIGGGVGLLPEYHYCGLGVLIRPDSYKLSMNCIQLCV